MPALGIRQPWAELILRGIKTIEVRAVPTNVRGTIYLYASRTPGAGEIVQAALDRHGLDVESLPRGELVGTVELDGCRKCTAADARAACVPVDVVRDRYGWVLKNPRRLESPLKPRFLPYGIWFYPFVRRNGAVQ
ncbi:MAG: ASCH domain-containing protein [Planctomycetaceae bacterium]|nr:ASCH domain-containing protein [Planctomycetaceae bacterium]